ncbi:hypothetical protein [Sporosarcina limicola]|uniref:Uncharacterized protein n=1 Tax=Sporosarcina limicola TaxID=34101 RepID=A0A927RBA8_9BACL|nr:hypothetical protein [Sporosarcina limicola]MBE1553200.1 hypothetical protein [Sporosarcina limicola]
MTKPSEIGKAHVLQVSSALKYLLAGESIVKFSDPVVQTAHFIKDQYPTIQFVINKFEMEQSDTQPSLLLTLEDQQQVKVNLFLIQGSAAIQPKNLGAKSFFTKYFGSSGLQTYFNDLLQQEYKTYLHSVIALKEDINQYDSIPMLKKKADGYYPKFMEDINPFRRAFLFSLREHCFQLLTDEYNLGATGIQLAFNELMLIESTTIITRYSRENKCLNVDRWKSNIDSTQGIYIYKKGNDTIGIRSGEEALTLRFKFESSPTSSVKLATSYEVFPAEDKVLHRNLRSIENFEMLIGQHKQLETTNKSNAIGKCNEAMVYYRILKENSSINQVDEQEYYHMLNAYSPIITHKELLSIQIASTITTQKMHEYLEGKYPVYQIESIQLVGDSYIDDRSETSDLQLILRVNGNYVVEGFSLKAASKRNVKITSKNPGIGQILGPTYFDIGSLDLVVKDIQKQFEQKLLNHQQVLGKVSEELGESLYKAPQANIKKGLAALLGRAPMVVTFYLHNDSVILEHNAIKSEIEVLPKTPSAIQTTLRWNDNQEELSLRVKFSKGQQYGWSSLKLACEGKIVK